MKIFIHIILNLRCDMSLAEAVALRIEDLLKEHNLTQYKLYKLSGVSQTSISDIRSKKNKAPNLYIVYELAQGFGMSLAEFFDCEYFKGFNIID